MLVLEKVLEEIEKNVVEVNNTKCALFCLLNDLKLNTWDCSDCKECLKNSLKKLAEEYKEPPIELTKFEYDLIVNCYDCDSYDPEDKLKNYWIIKGMKQKGHFKDVDLHMTFKEVLENCVVKKDGN